VGQAGLENRSAHATIRRSRRGAGAGRGRRHGDSNGDRCTFAVLSESVRGQLSTDAIYRVHAAAAHAISAALHAAAAHALLSAHTILSTPYAGMPEPSCVLHQSAAALHTGKSLATVLCGESEPGHTRESELHSYSPYADAANDSANNAANFVCRSSVCSRAAGHHADRDFAASYIDTAALPGHPRTSAVHRASTDAVASVVSTDAVASSVSVAAVSADTTASVVSDTAVSSDAAPYLLSSAANTVLSAHAAAPSLSPDSAASRVSANARGALHAGESASGMRGQSVAALLEPRDASQPELHAAIAGHTADATDHAADLFCRRRSVCSRASRRDANVYARSDAAAASLHAGHADASPMHVAASDTAMSADTAASAVSSDTAPHVLPAADTAVSADAVPSGMSADAVASTLSADTAASAVSSDTAPHVLPAADTAVSTDAAASAMSANACGALHPGESASRMRGQSAAALRKPGDAGQPELHAAIASHTADATDHSCNLRRRLVQKT